MCLAAGFSPKEGTMSLSLEKTGQLSSHSVSTAVLSKSGTYYYAAFSTDGIKECEFMKETASKVKLVKSTPPPQEECPQIDNTAVITNTNNTRVSSDPKGKSMTVLVNGLRLLLAKAVALNVMMTIKAFLI
ncbi:uncharacterized protein LOC134311246 [Trichomycterus rosablanca]|uniref:uncharacterized protein LOC134311246 n=1 Tax=Trichomycterus rosablanca TaxID=2290929 RepID=UPI002F356493